MAPSDPLTVRQVDGRVVVRLNRAESGNALNGALVDALHDAIDRAESDGTRLLIINGEGQRHFCTGFDLSDIDAIDDSRLLHRFVRIELMLQRLHSAPFVTVAIASGRAMGAGADLFVACERRIIVHQASFCFPGAGFGIVLGFGRLSACVGEAHARNLVQSGRTLDSSEALQMGLATETTSAEQLDLLIAREAAAASRLDPQTARAIRNRPAAHADRDLAALVRSAARPGLRDRILAYRAAVRVRTAPKP